MTIVLIGLPRVGKTTLGSVLAETLNLSFRDSDRCLEDLYYQKLEAKKNVNEIYCEHGEAYFRTLEFEVLSNLNTDKSMVLATGGGCVMHNETRKLLPKIGICVYLAQTFEQFQNRLQNVSAPAGLAVLSDVELKTQFDLRSQYYAELAQHTIWVQDDPVDTLCERILKIL